MLHVNGVDPTTTLVKLFRHSGASRFVVHEQGLGIVIEKQFAASQKITIQTWAKQKEQLQIIPHPFAERRLISVWQLFTVPDKSHDTKQHSEGQAEFPPPIQHRPHVPCPK
jgi:hypothetical protein